jgi:hypothetical protein
MLADASAELSAAYVTGSVAALAIIGSLVTTWLTLRHQRALARDERLATQRADAYIRLIEYQHIDPGFRNLLPAEGVAPLKVGHFGQGLFMRRRAGLRGVSCRVVHRHARVAFRVLTV